METNKEPIHLWDAAALIRSRHRIGDSSVLAGNALLVGPCWARITLRLGQSTAAPTGTIFTFVYYQSLWFYRAIFDDLHGLCLLNPGCRSDLYSPRCFQESIWRLLLHTMMRIQVEI